MATNETGRSKESIVVSMKTKGMLWNDKGKLLKKSLKLKNCLGVIEMHYSLMVFHSCVRLYLTVKRH